MMCEDLKDIADTPTYDDGRSMMMVMMMMLMMLMITMVMMTRGRWTTLMEMIMVAVAMMMMVVMPMAGEKEAHQKPRRGLKAHHMHTPDGDG